MSNSNEETSRLDHLVQVLNSGTDFYEHARERIRDRKLRELFDANVADRQHVLDELQKQVTARMGNPEKQSDLEARLEEYRAELEAVLKFNEAHVYMDHLEHLEVKTGETFQEALAVTKSSGLRELLLGLEHIFRRMRERMQAAREATAERRIPMVGINQIREVHRGEGQRE